MNEQDRKHQQDRIDRYKGLQQCEHELIGAIDMIKPSGDNHFTGNASRVRSVREIVIKFSNEEFVLRFEMIKLDGWNVSNALTPILKELLDRVWKEQEKI